MSERTECLKESFQDTCRKKREKLKGNLIQFLETISNLIKSCTCRGLFEYFRRHFPWKILIDFPSTFYFGKMEGVSSAFLKQF